MEIDLSEIIVNFIDFFNHPFFSTIGGIATLLALFSTGYTIYLILKGVLPIWYRLGMGLSNRKIAIFAMKDYSSLRSMLTDSKIFDAKNIKQVNIKDIDSIDKESIFLVYWDEYKDHIDKILTKKKDSTALIIYIPHDDKKVDKDSLDKINAHRNSILVNMRGRLLNDILTCLITTSYERK